MKRKSTKVICLALFIGLCALLAKSASNKNPSYEEQLRKINLNQDLTKILHKKKFKMIVTHNPDGEYGHIHHKMISKMVTKIASKSNMKLYYFNHYYTRRQLKNLELTSELSKQDSRQKLTNLNTFYPSQKKVIEHLKHILPYEQFISQKKWSSSKS